MSISMYICEAWQRALHVQVEVLGVLNFHFGRRVGPKMGAFRTDQRQISGFAELIFC